MWIRSHSIGNIWGSSVGFSICLAKSIAGWDCPMVATQKCFRSANETGVLASSKSPKWQVFFLKNIYIYMHIVFLMVFLMFMHNREMGKIGYDKMR